MFCRFIRLNQVVPEVGIEPRWACARGILSPIWYSLHPDTSVLNSALTLVSTFFNIPHFSKAITMQAPGKHRLSFSICPYLLPPIKPKKPEKIIQENIADWNLAQADKLLYGIEDTFDEIESELD
ncbi:MAG: hypothetical protein KKD92_01785 [Proteobacteria bacterium]|nr:hypothetical protein [Pseudomonadota bacterium]